MRGGVGGYAYCSLGPPLGNLLCGTFGVGSDCFPKEVRRTNPRQRPAAETGSLQKQYAGEDLKRLSKPPAAPPVAPAGGRLRLRRDGRRRRRAGGRPGQRGRVSGRWRDSWGSGTVLTLVASDRPSVKDGAPGEISHICLLIVVSRSRASGKDPPPLIRYRP